MTSVTIGNPTLENLTTALTAIGFTADTTDNTKFFWDNDTNKTFYMQMVASGTNIIPKLFYADGTVFVGNTNLSLSTTAAHKMDYELLEGGGIAIGFTPTAQNYTRIAFIIAAPISQTDHWLLSAYNSNYVGNTSTKTSKGYGQIPMLSEDISAVQVVKLYDGTNFCDNFYITTLCKSIQGWSSDNTLRATIGGNLYLIVNMSGTATNNKYAVRIAS